MRSSTSVAGLPDWSNAWGIWKSSSDRPGARDLNADENKDHDPFEGSIAPSYAALQQAMRHDQSLIAGIAAYRRHPSRRTQPDPPAVWQDGEARLLDYAPGNPGRPVLFVPSLINRGYILDLSEGSSLLRFLAGNGLRPLLLDWGWPGQVERRYSLTDYIVGTLERAITYVGQPVVLAGYCMGGLLATAVAQRCPDRVRALAVLATPWDFRAYDPQQADTLAQLMPLLLPFLEVSGTVPVDLLQSLFAMLDPDAVAEKFRRFGRLEQQGTRAKLFVAIEDWVNDGVPLAAQVARECFVDWYGSNSPARGEWRVAGMVVAPQALRVPCFVAVPGRDRVVPRQSAWPLACLLPNPRVIEPPAGHVSMIVGSGAEAALWRPLLDWLRLV